jgi:hypothetical protein
MTTSSSMVFHSPQVSQRPAHFGVTAPQDRQTKREAALANATPDATGEGVGYAVPGRFSMAVPGEQTTEQQNDAAT